MPIYEFYCSHCHRVFSFLSSTVNTTAAPSCPRCGKPELPRRVSVFAIGNASRKSAVERPEGAGPGDPNEDRIMQAMAELGPQLDNLDNASPQDAARLMRRLYGAMGEPVDARMEEAFRRMEAGEDPDRVEEEMGDVLGEGAPGVDGAEASGGTSGETSFGAMRRRVLPPSVDETLYDLD